MIEKLRGVSIHAPAPARGSADVGEGPGRGFQSAPARARRVPSLPSGTGVQYRPASARANATVLPPRFNHARAGATDEARNGTREGQFQSTRPRRRDRSSITH